MVAGPAIVGVEAVPSARTIPPGGSGYVLVTFNYPAAGARDAVVRVRSNDAVEPEQTLALRFAVVP